MLSRLDQVAEDRCLAQLLAGFQAVQPLHQDETIAIAPDQDRRLLTDLQYALRDVVDDLGIERAPALDRHIDVGDRERLALHHQRLTPGLRGTCARCRPAAPRTR